MPKRNVMEAFSIGELSAVDVPAQQHARATFVKRQGGSRLSLVKRGDREAEDAHLADQLKQAHAKIMKARAATEKEETMTTNATDIEKCADWDQAVAIMKARGHGPTDAMAAARRARPDLFKLMQTSVDSDSILKGQEYTKAEQANRDAQRAIQKAVRDHVAAGMDRYAALRKVRDDKPELFAA